MIAVTLTGHRTTCTICNLLGILLGCKEMAQRFITKKAPQRRGFRERSAHINYTCEVCLEDLIFSETPPVHIYKCMYLWILSACISATRSLFHALIIVIIWWSCNERFDCSYIIWLNTNIFALHASHYTKAWNTFTNI